MVLLQSFSVVELDYDELISDEPEIILEMCFESVEDFARF
jgi:hypothetical protein